MAAQHIADAKRVLMMCSAGRGAELRAAEAHAMKADCCLALGSSLTVTPAADIPESVGAKKFRQKGGSDAELYIVNLQKTPLDWCGSRLNGKCGEVE